MIKKISAFALCAILLMLLCSCRGQRQVGEYVDYDGTNVRIPQSLAIQKAGEDPVEITDERDYWDFAADFTFCMAEREKIKTKSSELKKKWQWYILLRFESTTTEYYINGNHLHEKNGETGETNSYQLLDEDLGYFNSTIGNLLTKQKTLTS